MKKNHTVYLILAIFLVTGILASCNKFVDVPLPNSQISGAVAFSDDGKANSSMRGSMPLPRAPGTRVLHSRAVFPASWGWLQMNCNAPVMTEIDNRSTTTLLLPYRPCRQAMGTDVQYALSDQ